ncbi:hypothetical protein PV10_06728 [Exophiala mesophila]|uniref:Large ribosomal subunit protein mL46 n=1 Tax=Exophiala mesophila TaxID=212818 RepID=A0A0D1ZZL4_EXOME|nr:uncharacterized protein PV10_06728 [Exophiala mesophila]KIV92273.1 hypothetical protein PV10_06728 [Exophiala mesophila]
MAPRSRGLNAIADSLIQSTSKSSPAHVCRSCRAALRHPSLQTRLATTAAAKASVETPSISQVTPSGPSATPVAQPSFIIKAGVVISRPPLITPDPHPFETAYYLYQRRLNERLVLPFTQYFYYKRNTPAFEKWREGRRARSGTATRDVGNYNAYSDVSWNDEVLVGDDTGSPAKLVQQLVAEEGRQDEFTGKGDPKYAGLRRRTDADENNDQRSLERSLSRTLYLLLKPKGKEFWTFPAGPVSGKEGLKEAAQRVLFASCGVNMNTFFVGNHPVGHYNQDSTRAIKAKASSSQDSPSKTNALSKQDVEADTSGEKTFFMKARIMAGQADLAIAENKDFDDFKWVSKEEVEKLVDPDYWRRIKNMLVAQ